MNEFQHALEIVHTTLSDLKESGVDLRASITALRRLEASRSALVVDQPPPISARVEEAARVAPRVDEEPAVAVSVVTPVRQVDVPVLGGKGAALAALRELVLPCTLCPHLVQTRTQVVFGAGNPEAELMFVGEAPDEEDDQQGEPFVGKAGQLLTKIIETMGFSRSEIYMSNVVKCRPDMPAGESRKPRREEMSTCLPYLKQQIEIIQPRVLVALGASAMEGLLGETQPMARLRGRWHQFEGIPVMATYHPSYLLHNKSLSEKRKVWEDMLLVLERLARPISAKQRNYFLPKS